MFSELLRLKKAGKLFSVFTRSGNILACRSRDSAPIRIASPEALQQLAGSGAARRPAQERAQSGDRSGLSPDSTPERVPDRDAGADVITPSGHSSGMEVEARSPSGPSRRGSYSHSGPRRAVAASDVAPTGAPSAVAARTVSGGRLVSSLLDCARGTVETVHLSPPLPEIPAGGSSVPRSPAGGEPVVAAGEHLSAASVGAAGDAAGDGARTSASRPPGAAGLEPPLPVALEVASVPQSPPLRDSRSGERDGGSEVSVSVSGSALPSGGRGGGLSERSPSDAGGGVSRPGGSRGGPVSRVPGGGAAGDAAAGRGDVRSSSVASRAGFRGGRGVSDLPRSRDIREYF